MSVTEPEVAAPAAAGPAAAEAASVEPPASVEPAATEPAATEPAATEPAATEPASIEPDEPGRLAQWLTRDPVRAVAVVMIVLQLGMRVAIASRGFLAEDDFVFVNRAVGLPLDVDFLLSIFNNHLMPAGLLIVWVVTHTVGLVYWPYLLLLTVGQLALSISFFRLLRLLVRPGWVQLVPLGLLLFSPLTLDTTSMWAVGMYLLPMELAMVWAIGSQVKFARTRRLRHLVSLAAALVFGLAFFEKSLLIVPLLILVTACLLVTGGPLRSLYRAAVRFWPAWLVLAVLSAAYLWLYFFVPREPLCDPVGCSPPLHLAAARPAEAVGFVRQLVGTTLVPGLMGGPWRWVYTGDGPPLVDPPELLRWLGWAAFLTLVVATSLRRRGAVRAWVLFAAYAALVTGLFTMTRLGAPLSSVAGLVPRYLSDAVVVGALCVAVALLGLRGTADQPASLTGTLPAVLREPAAVAVGMVVSLFAVVAVGVGTVTSAARFGDGWAVKHGRDYLQNAERDLAAAPPGTVFFDEAVPNVVVAGFFWPDNLQSHFLQTLPKQPVFVTEAEKLSMFDDDGHVRPAWVAGRANVTGPVLELNCGHRVADARPTVIALNGNTIDWDWVVRIGYLASGDTTATFWLGRGHHEFAVHKGLNQIYFKVHGSGPFVELTLADPAVSLCTNEVIVGTLVPKPPQ